MIKDNINLYNNLSDLRILCYSCFKGGHTIIKCPLLHYVPDKRHIIRKFQKKLEKFEKNHLEYCKKFKRKLRKKTNPLWMYGNLNKAAKLFKIYQKSNGLDFILENEIPITNAIPIEKKNVILDVESCTLIGDKDEVDNIFNSDSDKNDEFLKYPVYLDYLNNSYNKLPKREFTRETFDFCSVKSYDIYYPNNNIDEVLADMEYNFAIEYDSEAFALKQQERELTRKNGIDVKNKLKRITNEKLLSKKSRFLNNNLYAVNELDYYFLFGKKPDQQIEQNVNLQMQGDATKSEKELLFNKKEQLDKQAYKPKLMSKFNEKHNISYRINEETESEKLASTTQNPNKYISELIGMNKTIPNQSHEEDKRLKDKTPQESNSSTETQNKLLIEQGFDINK